MFPAVKIWEVAGPYGFECVCQIFTGGNKHKR